jgi:hypothetical protein
MSPTANPSGNRADCNDEAFHVQQAFLPVLGRPVSPIIPPLRPSSFSIRLPAHVSSAHGRGDHPNRGDCFQSDGTRSAKSSRPRPESSDWLRTETSRTPFVNRNEHISGFPTSSGRGRFRGGVISIAYVITVADRRGAEGLEIAGRSVTDQKWARLSTKSTSLIVPRRPFPAK